MLLVVKEVYYLRFTHRLQALFCMGELFFFFFFDCDGTKHDMDPSVFAVFIWYCCFVELIIIAQTHNNPSGNFPPRDLVLTEQHLGHIPCLFSTLPFWFSSSFSLLQTLIDQNWTVKYLKPSSIAFLVESRTF